jgi:tRNA 5-methylaminomethyl-2-thiouridine biosynthesis bifunctional protein
MPEESPLEWTADGRPRSRLFGDVYFSDQDGLAESRAVFLAGCGLPEAWAGRRRFVVGELGFGTGLNILALFDLWRRARPADAQLHVFSVEAHPISAAEAARALARWPELADLAGLLAARWPGRAHGFHRVELPELAAVLDLAVMDAAEALAAWSGRADAWFLDGFSPALNPAMWSDEVLSRVGMRSAPGARAATFTVAGQVRRGLAAAGFDVARRPGFGRKRERLEAQLPGEPSRPSAPPRVAVAVVGAGVAGASAARALRVLGANPLVLEAVAIGAGGSGNPAALVTPRLDAGGGPPARLFAQAFARAVQLYEGHPEAILARGVLQLEAGPRDRERFARIAACGLFEPGALAPIESGEASARLGEPAPAALDQAAALVIDPSPVLRAWAGEVRQGVVAALRRGAEGWTLLDAAGAALAEADAVILAAGMGSAVLALGAPLQPVRGQASFAQTEAAPSAAAWGGYVVPTREGVLFGATHDRGDEGVEVREADHARNLAALAERLPALASRLSGRPIQGRASVRAVTPDRLPLAGGRDGLYLLTGFGSRGFAFAPLLAEHVAALAVGAPSPLPAPLATLVDPERFERRARTGGAARQERAQSRPRDV